MWVLARLRLRQGQCAQRELLIVRHTLQFAVADLFKYFAVGVAQLRREVEAHVAGVVPVVRQAGR